MGDLNAHHNNWDPSREAADNRGNEIAEWCIRNNSRVINEENHTHTHRSTGNGSSPDITICHKSRTHDTSWKTLESIGSDHLPIKITVNWFSKRPPLNKVKTKAWKKADWNKFREITENIFKKWSTKPPKNIWAADVLFRKNILDADAATIPSSFVKRPNPWWNQRAQEAVKKRNEARKKAHVSAEHRNEWNSRTKECRSIINEEKKKAWQDFCNNISTSTDVAKVARVMKSMEDGNF